MIDLDLIEGLKSFSTCESPTYYMYLNGREYEMREVEALFLSEKVQRIFANDKTVNNINIEIKKEDIFSDYDIGETDFNNVLRKSFERILDTVHHVFINNYIPNTNLNNIDKENDSNNISLEELCCTKAILDILESKSVKVKECIFDDIEEIERLGKEKGFEKVIEILNVIGSEKSIEYVGKHLMEIKEDEGRLIGKISPGRLEEVLRSEGVRVRGEGDILRVVEESIRVYGWGAGFLLGCVEASLLSWRDRNRYIELISQYISAINGINDNNNHRIEGIREYRRYNRESVDDGRRRIKGEKEWKGEIQIEGEIVESLLRCVGNNGGEGLKVCTSQSIDIRDKIIEVRKRIGVSESLMQCGIIEEYKAKNLNECFKGRITASAKTINGNDKPENVLIPGDGQSYWSARNINSRDQWIQFDFPEEICARKLDIRPYGNKWNPQRLNIKAVKGENKDQIGLAEFPNEGKRTYAFETTKSVWTKSIRIEMEGETYCDDVDRYVLFLNEVIIYGHTL